MVYRIHLSWKESTVNLSFHLSEVWWTRIIYERHFVHFLPGQVDWCESSHEKQVDAGDTETAQSKRTKSVSSFFFLFFLSFAFMDEGERVRTKRYKTRQAKYNDESGWCPLSPLVTHVIHEQWLLLQSHFLYLRYVLLDCCSSQCKEKGKGKENGKMSPLIIERGEERGEEKNERKRKRNRVREGKLLYCCKEMSAHRWIRQMDRKRFPRNRRQADTRQAIPSPNGNFLIASVMRGFRFQELLLFSPAQTKISTVVIFYRPTQGHRRVKERRRVHWLQLHLPLSLLAIASE